MSEDGKGASEPGATFQGTAIPCQGGTNAGCPNLVHGPEEPGAFSHMCVCVWSPRVDLGARPVGQVVFAMVGDVLEYWLYHLQLGTPSGFSQL